MWYGITERNFFRITVRKKFRTVIRKKFRTEKKIHGTEKIPHRTVTYGILRNTKLRYGVFLEEFSTKIIPYRSDSSLIVRLSSRSIQKQ